MGIFRFFLALSVVFSHAGSFMGFNLGDGRLATQTFYMISGFYMSMIWTTKYSMLNNPIQSFYVSRALRIYPLYYVILAFSFILAILFKLPPWQYALENHIDLFPRIWVYITQITLIGMETSIFFSMHEYWISPVAWSLGLELSFYLCVPFLIPRPYLSMVMLISSLIARYAMITSYGWHANSTEYSLIWSYRFFPFEISLFIFGALSYKFFEKIKTRYSRLIYSSEIHFFSLLSLIGWLCYWPWLFRKFDEAAYWGYYLVVFLFIFILFENSKQSKFDRYIGELSFPIYISHFPIIWMLSSYISSANIIYATIPLTLFLSMVLVRLQNSIDNFRHSLTTPR
jgi:peptidoglycan/LPS O-acetylase OafA/YrhL